MPSPANGLGHLVRGSVGVGGDVLEEHLRELASGVVRHVSVQAVAVGLGHLLLQLNMLLCTGYTEILPD